ncbi:MAG: RNA methyltransferase [Clostridiales bacterium]|nr:RNA methyltransferase [Clostridiales bacterium]
MNEIITSLQNPQVKAWRALNKSRAERVKQGLFLAEGEHMAQEAVKENKARALLIEADARDKFHALANDARGIPVYALSGHVMAALSDAKTPQGVAALCDYPKDCPPDTLGDWLIALDGVQDPGNVGTILRTMDAAGFTGLLMDEKCADPYSPKALRASMGGVFRVPATRCKNLASSLHDLACQGYEIIAGDLHGAPFYQRGKAKEKICIVIGNEGAGISPSVMEEATLRLKLPIVGGAESLNAAVAGAIMMYDFLREKMG